MPFNKFIALVVAFTIGGLALVYGFEQEAGRVERKLLREHELNLKCVAMGNSVIKGDCISTTNEKK